MITLNDENFEKEILSAQKPVLVDFWAVWCAPCSILSPILEKITEEFKEKIIFAKINLDETPITAQKFGIDKIPTVILFKEGKPINGFIGIQPEPVIREWLVNLLESNNANEIRETIGRYEEYAKKNGFKLNSDEKVVEGIVKALLEREKRFGARYCPCRRITGNKEEDKKIICPCVYHREEIDKDGHCLCRLFVQE